MKREILSILLVVCMVLTLAPLAAFAEAEVSYLDADGTPQTCSQYTVVTSGSFIQWGDWGENYWYVVQGDVTIDGRVIVYGDVHLILTDGCDLTVNGGIQVEKVEDIYISSLTIYAQSTDKNTMGRLTARSGRICGDSIIYRDAAIGGDGGFNSEGQVRNGGSGGEVIINGGIVEATSGDGAGIGGGWGDKVGGSGGEVIINGGSIKATSASGAGIGGGLGENNGGIGNFQLNNGNAVVFASSIADNSDEKKATWHRL